MSGERTIEQQISAWLEEEAVGTLPDRVLEAAFAETRQLLRRPSPFPWRFAGMPRSVLTLFAVGAAAIVVLVGAMFLGSHPPTVGSSPNPTTDGSPASIAAGGTAVPTVGPTPRQLGSPLPEPAFGSTFTSDIYNDSLKYPASWKATPAATAWTGTIRSWTDLPGWGAAGLDAIAGADARLSVWGEYVPQSSLTQRQAAEQWVQGLSIGAPACEASSQLPSHFMVKAYDAYTIVNGCASTGGLLSDGVTYQVAVVPLSHLWNYGWVFTFDGHVDAPYVRAMLALINLDGPRSF